MTILENLLILMAITICVLPLAVIAYEVMAVGIYHVETYFRGLLQKYNNG